MPSFAQVTPQGGPTAARVPLRLLLVEDDESDALLLLQELDRLGYQVHSQRVQSREEMLGALKADWDLIISDYNLPQFDALGALEVCADAGSEIPFIIVSGTISEDEAVESMRRGAEDFITKGRLARLGPAIIRGLRERRERRARHAAEMGLLQLQKLQAVGQLAGGVAHDFNNLLGVIQGYGEMLLRTLPAEGRQRERVEQMLQAAARGAALTRQLLAFSRQQPLELRVLELTSIVSNVEKMLRRLIGEDIQVVIVSDSRPARVRVDPTQIEQVIMNLAINARDAMPDGGRLTIETANADLDAAYTLSHPDARPGPHVLLAVSDNGTGMSADIVSHIFEPFFTTKEQGKGTGLGLATVYGIVRQSGGHVAVDSEVGHGTTFRVYLPRVEEPASKEQPAVDAARTTGTETILVIEDEGPLRDVLIEQLACGGYEVVSGSSVEGAIEAAASHRGPIHLVITDVVMPVISGREAVARVRAVRPDIRVLYMSGYTSPAEGLDGATEAGAPFLQKPFSLDTLLRKARDVLDRPRGEKS